MSRVINLTGQKFGRLTVIKHVENNKGGRVQWLCWCNCGNEAIIRADCLRNGRTKSCGCLAIEIRTRHGHFSNNKMSKTYIIWANMIQRCTNPNVENYKDYGGRGIKVCKRWLKFENFFEDTGEQPLGLTFDRVNNNGDYCKENCKWSTHKEQQRNMRSNILITIDGVTKCLAEWCEIYQKSYNAIWARIYRYCWTPEEALEIIPRKKKNHEPPKT